MAEGETVRNFGFRHQVYEGASGRFSVKLEWMQDPPPPPVTAERPEYRGTSATWGDFDTRAEAEAALDAKIAELS